MCIPPNPRESMCRVWQSAEERRPPSNPYPFPLPLRRRGLASRSLVHGEGRVFLGGGGSFAPPTPQASYPLSAMCLRILASQSAERGQGVRPEAGFSTASQTAGTARSQRGSRDASPPRVACSSSAAPASARRPKALSCLPSPRRRMPPPSFLPRPSRPTRLRDCPPRRAQPRPRSVIGRRRTPTAGRRLRPSRSRRRPNPSPFRRGR